MQTVHDVLKNPWLRLIMIVLVIVLLCWLIYYMRDILVPFLLAFIVAYIFSPAVDLLERIKIPRGFGVLILVLILITFLGGIVTIVAYDVQSAMAQKAANVPQAPDSNSAISTEVLTNPQTLNDRLETQINRLPAWMKPYANQSVQMFYKYIIPKLKNLLQYADQAIITVITSAVNVVMGILNFLIFVVVTFYLLRDYHVFLGRCLALIPPQYRGDAIRLTSELDADLRGFFRGQLMVAATLSVLYFVGLTIAGIPYAVPVAIISGIGNLIPYMGTFVGICLGFGASSLNYGFDIHLLYVIIVFVAAQSIDGMFISPYLLGRNVGLNPVVIILALMVFAKLLGFLGVLFAVPLAALVRVILRELYARIEIKGRIQTAASPSIIVPNPQKPSADGSNKNSKPD